MDAIVDVMLSSNDDVMDSFEVAAASEVMAW
jgi:hypothetical protein